MIDSIELPEKRRRSASQLENMLSCGESYRLERVAKAPKKQAAWFTQGIGFHEAVDRWESSGRGFGVDDMVKIYEDAFDAELARQMEIEPDTDQWMTGSRKKGTQDIDDRLERGRQQVRDYFDYANATAHEWRVWEIGDGLFASEVGFDIEIDGIRVVGAVDAAIEWIDTGQITLRDYKTGTKQPPHARQLGVYRIAFDRLFGVDIQWGDFYMCKNNAPTAPTNLTRFTEERIGRWFRHVDSMINQQLFIPNPGDHCRVCLVERFCDFKGPDSDQYPIQEASTITQ